MHGSRRYTSAMRLGEIYSIVFSSQPFGLLFCSSILLAQIRCVEFSPCGTMLAATSFDGTTWLWEYLKEEKEWEAVTTLEGHENEVSCSSATLPYYFSFSVLLPCLKLMSPSTQLFLSAYHHLEKRNHFY